MPAAYPTIDDLKVRLVAVGVFSSPLTTAQAALNLSSALAWAVDEWERRTGFHPFLATAGDRTYYFDGDLSRVVDLDGGFVSITSVTLNGITMTLDTDYHLMPRNADANARPITYLKWVGWRSPSYRVPGQVAPVSVLGRRGAYLDVPATAWEAIMALAILAMIGQTTYLNLGDVKSWKSGTDEEEYFGKQYGSLMDACNAAVSSAITLYRRVKVA